MDALIKQKTRIMIPEEYNAIRTEMNRDHRLVFDGLLFTGMRATEFWRFMDHPQWFHTDRQYVELPQGSMLKVKARQSERTVLLSDLGNRALRDLIDAVRRNQISEVSRQAWGETLARAVGKTDLDPTGVVPKMTRKTWVSWLMSSPCGWG